MAGSLFVQTKTPHQICAPVTVIDNALNALWKNTPKISAYFEKICVEYA